jgi:hypothetical protein
MSVTIVQADLENWFGESNIQVWSDLENSGSTDTDRVAAAIGVGQDKVRDAFRGSAYAVPFNSLEGTLYPVKDWMVKLAGHWLYFSRGMRDTEPDERMRAMAEEVEREMREYQDGRRWLNAERADTMPTAPQVAGG